MATETETSAEAFRAAWGEASLLRGEDSAKAVQVSAAASAMAEDSQEEAAAGAWVAAPAVPVAVLPPA
jgi:hypothetical protein